MFTRFYQVYRFTPEIKIFTLILIQYLFFTLSFFAIIGIFGPTELINNKFLEVKYTLSLSTIIVIIVAAFKFSVYYLLLRFRVVFGGNYRKTIIIGSGDETKFLSDYFNDKKEAGFKLKKIFAGELNINKITNSINDFNLKNIKILKDKFKCRVGISDHSTDNRVAIAAIASGAEVIEKHIALNNQKKGFDIKFSLKGSEIKDFREDIDVAWKLRGRNYFYRNKSENINKIFKRSIYVVKKIKKGDKFTMENISVIRPGFSLNPIYYYKILNKKAKKNYLAGDRIKYSQVF